MRMKMIIAVMGMIAVAASPTGADSPIVDFTLSYDLESIEQNDVKITLVKDRALRIHFGHAIDWPGITIKAPKGKWDLARYVSVAMDVYNPGEVEGYIGLRIDNPGGDGSHASAQRMFRVGPGERRTVKTEMTRRMPDDIQLFGMRGYPPAVRGYRAGDKNIDTANVIQLIIFVSRPQVDNVFEISRIRGDGKAVKPPTRKDIFPFIDRFGQYIHKDWPGKIHSEKDFAGRIVAEEKDLEAHPGPGNWNRWGGWEDGPKLKATGFFYPKKHDGKWWLVDPDGRLFWSHGVDCVGTWSTTVITEREHWHRNFPGGDGEFETHGWEQNSRDGSHWKGEKVYVFNWAGANSERKFGSEWDESGRALAHRRLRSWGLNTIGNWSDKGVCALKRTPYTIAVHWWCKQIEGSREHPGSFYDAFDPEFRKNIRKRMESEKGKTAGDPWCIGYFVDNELKWGGDTKLAVTTLASPDTQAAKRVFVKDLRKKYRRISKLNEAWGTSYSSWKALRLSRTPPGGDKAKPDLEAFTYKFAAKYFEECRDAVKMVAPDNLYLGCRFAGWEAPEQAQRAAVEFCDIVSFNFYTRNVGWAELPDDADHPMLVGEFHFGALDRGMFSTGLQGAESQRDRAEAYKAYVTSALGNHLLVGTHWFQYRDQATTGRFDGENYQIGFVDVCDTPYPETVAAAREIGDRIYDLRISKE